MDIRKIKKLIEIFEKSNITELEISEGKNSLKISCLSNKKNILTSQEFFSHDKLSSTNSSSNNNINLIKENNTKNEYIVKSPMVGIFYNTVNTQSKPLITIGQEVKKGDTICIVEAMKMMNQIIADKSGMIKKIFVENGQPVEFDEPLLIID